jgi:hypothetical protein
MIGYRIAPVAALVLGLAACGGDDDGGGDGDLTAAEVVAGLEAAGLPIEDVTVYDESSDPNELLGRPGQYTGKAGFRDGRLPEDLDPTETVVGDVETFADGDALDDRADYLAGFAENTFLGGWYQFEAGNAILRVTFELTPDQADEYEAALEGLY